MEIAGRVSRALATWGRASTIPGQFAKIPEFRFGEVGIVVTNVLIIDNYLTITASCEIVPNLGSKFVVFNFYPSSLSADCFLVEVKPFKNKGSGLRCLIMFGSLQLVANLFDLLDHFIIVVQNFHEVSPPFYISVSWDTPGYFGLVNTVLP